MSQTPEGKVKQSIKAYLSGVNAYYHMPVQNGMGEPTLDFIGCYRGFFFAIEAKAPGKHMSDRQKLTGTNMEAAHGKVFVVDNVAKNGGLVEVIDWVSRVDHLFSSAKPVRDTVKS